MWMPYLRLIASGGLDKVCVCVCVAMCVCVADGVRGCVDSVFAIDCEWGS